MSGQRGEVGGSPSDSVRVLVLARLPFRLDDLGVEDDPRFSAHLVRRPETLEAALEEFRPSVLLVDTEFPERAGIDAIAEALVRDPEVRVLALAPDPPPHDEVALATRAGAAGFIDMDAEPAEFAAAIQAVHNGDAWYPPQQTAAVLREVADDVETTAAERRSRLTGLVLALIPLTGLIAAVQSALWRRYLSKIGVRPVDLAVDPASRVIDAIVTMLFVVGVFGPLLFVGNWLELLRGSRFNRGLLAKILQRRKLAHVLASALWLVIAYFLALGIDVGLVLVIGPIVSVAILAKALGANAEIPRLIRIEGVSTGVAVGGVLFALFAFVAVLGYEVLVVGPDLRTDGEHGFLTPRVLGINAQPMKAFNVDTGDVTDYLYLGGNADLYVLVDPCDDDRVDLVSVGAHRLVVIDEVTCEPD